jgi:hypothetical protein
MINIQELNRSNPSLRQEEIIDILPGFFPEDYPLLIKLFEYYFDYVRENDTTGRIDDLFKSRDITSVSEDLLQFLQQELFVGCGYVWHY